VSKSKVDEGDASVCAKATVYLMELPQVFTAGQVEPQIEIPVPNSRSANEFIRPYMSFHILRMFKKAHNGGRLKFEDVARAFPSESNTAIRKRMKEVATFERGGGDFGWWKKKPASQHMSEDDLRAIISPESVCLYESRMAGLRRLRDIGLVKIFNPTEIDGAVETLIKRLESRKQSLTAKLIDPLGLERRAKEKAEEELWKKDAVIRKLETDIQVARYISEELQLTPWNLINNYVECHLQGKGSGMLQLSGVGDPTGRGEGFSFVRVPQARSKRRSDEEGVSGGIIGAECSLRDNTASITGTMADLRKLKMKELGAVLRNLGVNANEVNTLHRWDRIHLLRDLSTRAYNVGAAGVLSKFVRDSRKSLSAQQQEYRKKCDAIYERQMNVLSNPTTTFSSDEEDMDFDEWEKDLEADILGGIDIRRGPKDMFTKGGSGLNRSKKMLAEREDAVELRRLMQEMKEDSETSAAASRRPDVNTSQLRIDSASSRSAPSSRPGGILTSCENSSVSSAIATPTDHLSRASSPTHGRFPSGTPNVLGDDAGSTGGRVPGRKVLKRTVRYIEENGTENVRIEFIVDDRQVARFRAMQKHKNRQQEAAKRSQSRKRKELSSGVDDSALANNAKMLKLG
jgi:transcription initiation factor TFIID subunit 1